jgi:hypothetical protein
MHVEAEMATWTKLLIMVSVLAFSGLLFKTLLKLPLAGQKGSAVKSLLALSICALAASGLFMFIGSHFVLYEPQVTLAYPVENRNANTTSNAQNDPTLEALWDKLTESQIQLEPDPDYTPDLSKEENREKVAKEYGTQANGDMPPNWVLSPNKVIGEVFRRTVDSDPFVTEAECRRQLESELLPKVVSNRLEQLLPSKVHRKVQIGDLAQYGIGLDFILREICVDEFTATVETSVGPMKKVHVLMEFGQWEDNALISKWMRHEGDIRLARFGKIAGLSLTGLALAWGLLRFDTYSRGYYSKQLLGGGVLAIIAVVAFLLRA